MIILLKWNGSNLLCSVNNYDLNQTLLYQSQKVR